jgi:hypothetical protein
MPAVFRSCEYLTLPLRNTAETNDRARHELRHTQSSRVSRSLVGAVMPAKELDHVDKERAKKLFDEFLKANPSATIGNVGRDQEKFGAVRSPWGDPSVAIILPEDPKTLADALNNLILPERLSAIWHRDARELEVIWTAFILSTASEEVVNRKFVFRHKSVDHECEFAEASNRLKLIGSLARPITLSETSWRNLQSFQLQSENPDRGIFREPLSFWIRNIDWDEDIALDLIHHLNFYMSYYDTMTPMVLVHSPAKKETYKPLNRYISGSFPNAIVSRETDSNALHFWAAARSGDQARRFLYYYRIIEYASGFHLDSDKHATLRKILNRPDALDSIQGTIEQIVIATSTTRQEESQRIESMLRATVDVGRIFQEVNKNADYFSKETQFDGGFKLDPFISSGTKASVFATSGISQTTKFLKEIRNALSHGRDVKTAQVIAPTHHNFMLLQPWVNLITMVAGEVMIHNEIV